MLHRYAGKPAADPAGPSIDGFPDKDSISGWAKDGVTWAISEKIITGNVGTKPPSIFPKDNALRGELATMTSRAIDFLLG